MDINSRDLPLQKVPLSKKTEKWKQASVDAYIGRAWGINNLAEREELERLYGLYNSEYDEEDLRYVTDPFDVEDGFPAKTQDFNIVRTRLDLLIGEAIRRPDKFRVVQMDDNFDSTYLDKKKSLLLEYTKSLLGEQPIGQDGKPMTPPEIQKYLDTNYKSMAEMTAFNTLKYLKEKLNLENEFVNGFKDLLIAGEEVLYVGVSNGNPYVKRINVLRGDGDRSEDIEFTEDGEYYVVEYQMTPSAIYERWSDKIDESTFDDILKYYQGVYPSNTGGQVVTKSIMYKSSTNSTFENDAYNTLSVYHVTWKSYARIAFVDVLNPETGEMGTKMIDENFKGKLPKGVEWEWVEEVWEGYRVGDDIYFGIQPLEYQIRDIDDPVRAKLPFHGIKYSDTNAKNKSLLAIMKPLQYMYIILWYRLELAMARDKGKVITMDITQIPKGLGVDVSKWLHYLSSVGVNFVNPYDCFAPGTKVIMSDGSIKNIEEIKVGDKVMGPDGKPRNVIDAHNGIDHMYRIKARSGADDQVVSSTHKVLYKEYNAYKDEYIEKLATPVELIEEVKDKPYKSSLRFLEKETNCNIVKESKLMLDPYILGLWLGDGSTGKAEITTADPEIMSYLEGYAAHNNMKVSTYGDSNSKAITFILSNSNNKANGDNNLNPLKEALRHYGILYNKDIPDDYMYASREDKLKLLAGLIDTDGHFSKRDNYYIFTQSESRKHIVEKAAFIARSLGFKCTTSVYSGGRPKFILSNKKITYPENTFSLSILTTGFEIPVKIDRKKSGIINKRGDVNLSSAFTVNYEGIGEFYGITLDGDKKFLLSDFTIVHNSGWDIPGREGGRPASFNQISELDLSMSKVIAEYIGLMDKIEQMVGEISGVTNQRLGDIQQYELANNVQRSVIQSSYITEFLFWKHDQLKRNVYNSVLDVAKTVWADSDKQYLHYMFDDTTRVFMKITDDFLYSTLSVIVSNTSKENENIQRLTSLLQEAMQNGATLTDAAELLTADNVTHIKTKLKEIERERQQMIQAQQQQEAQMQQVELQLTQQKMLIEKENALLKAQTDIEVAKIQAEPKSEDNDIKVAKIQADLQAKIGELEARRKEIDEEIRKNKAAEQIQREEIAVKKRQVTNKNKTK